MGTDSSTDEDVVEGSKLGRREYWESTYKKELVNLQQHGDLGEVWFGQDVMQTMVSFIDDMLKARHGSEAATRQILDVGTGNALLLLELARLGYQKLTGTDYSQASIALAGAIVQQQEQLGIRLVQDDLLHTQLTDRFAVVTDKGTLDAVGLSAEALVNRRLYREASTDLSSNYLNSQSAAGDY
ncbi:hypothetical protein WJX72_002428 [[Myrmecia] bisecta]|uniref:Methyltransferase domain-containing protein n=1 Tax=[Myrmecia] bisecta TaxID=41462 RepID=A0AAW1P372_9CHLO